MNHLLIATGLATLALSAALLFHTPPTAAFIDCIADRPVSLETQALCLPELE